MPFWKKSEDPWDIDPNKRRPPAETEETGEPIPGLLEELRGWYERRKAARKAAEERPPMTCPWCGREMETGYLHGGRDGVYWQQERPAAIFSASDAVKLDTDGTFWGHYKFVWYCEDCRRLVLDIPEQLPDGAFAEQPKQYQAQQENSKENDI